MPIRNGRNSMAEYEKKRRSDYAREKDEDGKEGVIAGRNAILEAMKSGTGIEKIFISRGEHEGSIVRILALAKEKKISVQECDRVKLEFLCGVRNHQGIVAYLAQKEYCTIDDILRCAEEKGEAPFILIADEIADPHNLGAIIRTAEACGAHGIIVPRHRGVGVTPVVAKSSAGAVFYVNMAKVTNIVQAIEELKKKGVWVYGTDAVGTSTLFETDFTGPCALVIGSEGNGMSRLVTEKCDFLLSIPMTGKINSLNASVAASVLMYETMRQRLGK